MRRTLQSILERTSIKNYQVTETNRLSSACRCYGTEPKTKERPNKPLHPYKNLHPWKSKEKFSEHLIQNIIYNQDGLVVLNKPYGISNKTQEISTNIQHKDPEWNAAIGIANSVDYTLSDALPEISKKLGYESLSIVKSPERHTSGVAILTNNEKKTNDVIRSLARARTAQKFSKSYWIVTTRSPKSNNGELQLGITKKQSPCQTYKQPVILTTWTANSVKRGDVKTFDVMYRVISNGDSNLASLMEIKCFTTKWHAIRVFASTVLLSPVLGDKIHGSRVKKVMGTYMNISPFVEAARELPILNPALLEKLKLNTAQRVIIPVHIHLREMILPSFLSRGKDLRLVAPLPPGFQWTCDQLQFKIPNEKEEPSSQLRIAASQ